MTLWFNQHIFLCLPWSSFWSLPELLLRVSAINVSSDQPWRRSYPQTFIHEVSSGYNSALYTQGHGDPAPSAPVRLSSGYLGINALIETRAGQFCKCWDIKKATFYYRERPQHKAAFHRCSIWTWLSWNRRGLIVSDLVEPSGQMPSLFTQSGRAGSWPTVDFHSM